MSHIDSVWEQKYAAGHRQRYPWDMVVSFVFRNAPKDRPRASIAILEVGCGTGSNLWFAAREGFRVAGVDGSPSAITVVREWFARDGLEGDFRVSEFTSLAFADASFDLVVDRGALTCAGFKEATRAVREVHRVLKPGGRFLFNPYCDSHSSARSGTRELSGLRTDIVEGTLAGAGKICFYGREDVVDVLGTGWSIHQLLRLELRDELLPSGACHAEWRIVAERL